MKWPSDVTEGHIPVWHISAGLQKWRKNLQLLVPFLIEPKIDLFSLEELQDPAMGDDSAKRLKVSWNADSTILTALLSTH